MRMREEEAASAYRQPRVGAAFGNLELGDSRSWRRCHGWRFGGAGTDGDGLRAGT